MDDQILEPVGPTARRLRVPVRWLREEAESGRVPHLKAGQALLFNVAAVRAALLERAAERREEPRP